jgi:hypothetical protein
MLLFWLFTLIPYVLFHLYIYPAVVSYVVPPLLLCYLCRLPPLLFTKLIIVIYLLIYHVYLIYYFIVG